MKVLRKICFLIIPLGLLIGVNSYYNSHSTNPIVFKKNAVFFVGSSRVRYGINPLLLKQNKNQIYNVGILGTTFFNNVVLAEHLIKEAKPKELFIELSPLFYTFCDDQKLLNVNPFSTFKHLLRYNSIHLKESIDIAEMIIFNNLDLKNNLKKILVPQKKDSIIGYLFEGNNNYHYNDSFLKPKDLKTKYNIDSSEYSYFISYLSELAKNHHVKIRFFLPLTYKREIEREIVSTVYQSLPDDKKVIYSKSFINQISHSEYLFDNNHFNYKGAEIMTSYFGQHYFN